MTELKENDRTKGGNRQKYTQRQTLTYLSQNQTKHIKNQYGIKNIWKAQLTYLDTINMEPAINDRLYIFFKHT